MVEQRRTEVCDLILERYLAGDLPAEERRALDVQRADSSALQSRIDELAVEKQAFLAKDPPTQFAHRMATRLRMAQSESESELAPVQRAKHWWKWLLAPSATAAVAATVVLTFSVTRVPVESPAAQSQDKAVLEQSPPAAGPREIAVDELETDAIPDGMGFAAGREMKPAPEARMDSGRSRKQLAEESTGRLGGAARKLAKTKDVTGQPPASAPTSPTVIADSPSPAPPARTAPILDADAESAVAGKADVDDVATASGAATWSSPPAGPKRSEVARTAKAKDRGEPEKKKGDVVGLSQAVVAAVVKKNKAAFKACLQAAQDQGSIESGHLELVLNWTVTKDGTVKGATVKGANTEIDAELKGCLQQKLTAWKFPESDTDTVIERMVLPVLIP